MPPPVTTRAGARRGPEVTFRVTGCVAARTRRRDALLPPPYGRAPPGAASASVDLMADADGRLLVLEVNSMPAWKSLQAVCGSDIADALAADLLARLSAAPGRGTPVHAVASR